MKSKFLKALPLVVAAILATTSVFGAKPDRKTTNTQSAASCGCPSTMDVDSGCVNCVGGCNAPARYDLRCPFGVFFSADFLYWQAREDNLAYGITTTNPIGSPPLNGVVLNPKFKWHPGVKVGLGFSFDQDSWDLFAEWTHYVSHNNTTTQAPVGGFIIPTLNNPATSVFSAFLGTPVDAAMTWRLIYNTADLNLSRAYCLGKMLNFTPRVGVRGSWFKQSYDTQYDGLRTALSIPVGVYRIHTKLNSWGLGPRFGVDTNWMLGAGFRLFGNVNASLLYTKFNVAKTQTSTTIFGTITALSVQNKRGNAQLRPNMDANLGIGWGSFFDNSNWHLDFAISYDFNYWMDANADMTFVDTYANGKFVSGGNLSLHGGTFRMRLDF